MTSQKWDTVLQPGSKLDRKFAAVCLRPSEALGRVLGVTPGWVAIAARLVAAVAAMVDIGTARLGLVGRLVYLLFGVAWIVGTVLFTRDVPLVQEELGGDSPMLGPYTRAALSHRAAWSVAAGAILLFQLLGGINFQLGISALIGGGFVWSLYAVTTFGPRKTSVVGAPRLSLATK